MLKEFKDFLIKGSVVDMAVGFIFGAAFATFVKSLVENVVMPPIGLLLGKVDFSQLFVALDGNSYATLAELEKAGAPAIKLGVFMNDTISFLILGFVVFMFIKSYNKLKRIKDPDPKIKTCSDCAMDIKKKKKKCGHCGNTAV